jgi:hypothetical protein
MIGDKSPLGYKEKKKGNSRGKASHESHNRLFHTQGSFVGGQTGNRWDIRPAELKARCDEAEAIYLGSRNLPEHLRDEVKYPLPTLAKARELFKQFCIAQNFRTAHDLEDFEHVLEWFDGVKWQPRETAPAGAEFRRRMEMPVERAVRLIRGVENWTRCSPDIIRTFLEHTERIECVNAKGEIQIKIDGKVLTFCNGGNPLQPETKVLCYHHEDDPQFLHLTSGDGQILGTWYQRGRTGFLDHEALAEAMRYTHAARETAKATANELATPARAGLEAMRAHNASVVAVCKDFVVTSPIPEHGPDAVASPVAAGLATASATRTTFETNPVKVAPATDCTEELLKRAASAPVDDETYD